jgi:serine/threonine protein kinase
MKFGNIIANKYTICHKIGNGSFSTTYLGYNKKTNNEVAIKMEYSPNKLIIHEAKILEYLQRNMNHTTTYIPQLFWCGKQELCNILVMTYISGISLQTYISNKNDMDMQSLLEIFTQTSDILTYIHSKQIIHRDIKPEHIIINNNKCWLIDFGLSTSVLDDIQEDKYYDMVNDMVNCTDFTGSLNYVSYQIHCGHNPTYNDDYVSLSYVILECAIHTLPWKQTVNLPNIYDTYLSIKNRKKWSQLCNYIPEKCLFINPYLHP